MDKQTAVEIRGRLDNWKFNEALNLYDEYLMQSETNEETEVFTELSTILQGLADLLGDSGWILNGSLSTVVRAAVFYAFEELESITDKN